ncbi:PLP-dependent transferase, partial [Salmonella enterica subsp. enterica serovar Minnesota]|uniref:PLP-dependent transferase n=1 Tax=Salmonella enterica TaxID=28901 RepID=UPI0021B41458
TLLRPGDEVIVSQTLYGCTFALLHHGIAGFGIKVRHVDLTDLDALHAALSPATRMIYCETPANPNLQLVDIAAVATLAHQ